LGEVLRATSARSPRPTQRPAAAANSSQRGEKISRKPRSFTRAAKLDTQNGVRKKRKTGHGSGLIRPDAALSVSAMPIMTLRPADVSQRRGRESKYLTTTTAHQMK
jgi:hypothetical protein